MCTADIMIKGTAAVQVMVDPVKTGFFEHFAIGACEKAHGAVEMSSVFFHFADPRPAPSISLSRKSPLYHSVRLQCLDK